jgi:hypothetical protein
VFLTELQGGSIMIYGFDEQPLAFFVTGYGVCTTCITVVIGLNSVLDNTVFIQRVKILSEMKVSC